jgi:hypothetical protein
MVSFGVLLHSELTVVNSIVYFKMRGRENAECPHYKEMISASVGI